MRSIVEFLATTPMTRADYKIRHLSVEACQCYPDAASAAAEEACKQDVGVQTAGYVGSFMASSIVGTFVDFVLAYAAKSPVLITLLAAEGAVGLVATGAGLGQISKGGDEAKKKCDCALFMQEQK